jgi:hypothetical protein
VFLANEPKMPSFLMGYFDANSILIFLSASKTCFCSLALKFCCGGGSDNRTLYGQNIIFAVIQRYFNVTAHKQTKNSPVLYILPLITLFGSFSDFGLPLKLGNQMEEKWKWLKR